MGALENQIIVVDPGHGGTSQTDSFRKGPTGLREETINLVVALELEKLLKHEGARVILTRNTDKFIDLDKRANLAIKEKADLFVSIHHNSSCPVDRKLNFSSVFIHGSLDEPSLGHELAREFQKFRRKSFVFSDQLIFEQGIRVLTLLNNKVCAVLGEFSFFSHPEEEERLKSLDYCQAEAQCYFKAIYKGFKNKDLIQKVHRKTLSNTWTPYLKEKLSDLHHKSWLQYLNEGEIFLNNKDLISFQESLENSLALFPNSPESSNTLLKLNEVYKEMGTDKKPAPWGLFSEDYINKLIFEV